MDAKENRLAKIIKELATKYEIPYKLDDDGQGGDVGIPDGKEMIFVGYSFSEDEDSYEFGSALAKVADEKISKLSETILKSVAIRGLSERIDSQNKLLIQGSRDGLRPQSTKQVELFLLDDWARVAEANDVVKKLID